jgi:formamidopyrimidine-DNA glycosylase
LHWKKKGSAPAGRNTLAAFHFSSGTLTLTEAGTQRRASLHVALGEQALNAMARAGIEVLECDLATFSARLKQENHTLKRALTDPDLFSGIGNAYSDEILHRAPFPIAADSPYVRWGDRTPVSCHARNAVGVD